MNLAPKILFYLAIFLIGCWLAILTASIFWGLEFVNPSIKDNYAKFYLVALPISILFTLLKTHKRHFPIWKKIAVLFTTIVVSMLGFIVSFLLLFSGMCSYTTQKVLFKNKIDSNIKIIVQEMECGAYDSGPPAIGIFKVTNFSQIFRLSTSIDTAKIDLKEWKKV